MHQVHGSYHALEGGSIGDVLVDLTGGVATKVKLDSTDPSSTGGQPRGAQGKWVGVKWTGAGTGACRQAQAPFGCLFMQRVCNVMSLAPFISCSRLQLNDAGAALQQAGDLRSLIAD